MTRPNTRRLYVDRPAVASAMAEQHQRKGIDWGDVGGWVALVSVVVAFWWWALFC